MFPTDRMRIAQGEASCLFLEAPPKVLGPALVTMLGLPNIAS